MSHQQTEPPRLDLARLPTPIERVERIREGWTVLVKRDDLTGTSLTGRQKEVPEARFPGSFLQLFHHRGCLPAILLLRMLLVIRGLVGTDVLVHEALKFV